MKQPKTKHKQASFVEAPIKQNGFCQEVCLFSVKLSFFIENKIKVKTILNSIK
jgi:hypothetical protein